MKRLIAAFALLATPAIADLDLAYDARVTTRFGDIHVGGQQFQQTLWHNQSPLPLPEDARWWVQWSAPGPGDFDWVLVSHHHGGNSCGGASYILRVGPEGVTNSRAIDDCSGRFLDIRRVGWGLEIDRTDPDIEVPIVTIRWDGNVYTETHIFDPAQPAAGAEADVTRWLGQHGADILEDASERARFASVMEIWEMQDLWTRLLVGGGVMQSGDWVFATGCQPHACGLDMGAIGMRISDGAVAAIIRSSGNPDRAFGLADNPAFRSAIADGFE